MLLLYRFHFLDVCRHIRLRIEFVRFKIAQIQQTSAKAENALRALPVEQGSQHRWQHRLIGSARQMPWSSEASVQDPERRAVATSMCVQKTNGWFNMATFVGEWLQRNNFENISYTFENLM